MIAKNSPDAGKATDFEKVLQNVLEKGWISRENLETSLIMMSGDKWSRYVATLADTFQSNRAIHLREWQRPIFAAPSTRS